MERQPQNPEFRVNLENFHACMQTFTFSIQASKMEHIFWDKLNNRHFSRS